MYGREYYYGGLGIEYSLPVSDLSLLLEDVDSETKPVLKVALLPGSLYALFHIASDGRPSGAWELG